MKRDCTCPRARHVHGHYLAYTRDACRCDPCTEAHRARHEHRRKQIAYGRLNASYTTVERTRQHIHLLRQNGLQDRHIAHLSGISKQTINRLGNNWAKRVLVQTEKQILNVTPNQITNIPHDYINGIGTARRIKALSTLGWGQATIARKLGVRQEQITAIVNYKRAAPTQLAKQVRDLYDKLWDKPHPDTREARITKTIAAKNGWLPPLAWDDERIDDPKHKGYKAQAQWKDAA